ncbi:hypothetical protein ACCS93_37595 [Rhizobium ruizarguesonis]
MADSDNSRTLPTVTRGEQLPFLRSGGVSQISELGARLSAPLDICNDHLPFAIWREWQATRQRLIESRSRRAGAKCPALLVGHRYTHQKPRGPLTEKCNPDL